MSEYRIAVVPGDGIGPEVVDEAWRVLETVASIFGFTLRPTRYPWGAEHYLKTKELMPAGALEEYRAQHAILLGAIGDPRVETGVLERAIVGGIRWDLDLYVNLRPIRLFAEHLTPLKDKKPGDIDFVVVRENTEDAYLGIGGFLKKGTPDEVAIQEMIYTRKGVERVIRYSFDLARRRAKRKKLTMVDKANAIRAHDLWTRTFAEVGKEYPDIAQDHAYVDAAGMWMVKNPEWFDTLVTTNMFGDILTDLGAMIQGGLGVAASGNIHPGRVSMFEPIHGSAPKYAGKNVANPIAAVAAVGMMLDFLGETKASAAVEGAIASALATKKVPSLSAGSGQSTREVGDVLIGELRRLKDGSEKPITI